MDMLVCGEEVMDCQSIRTFAIPTIQISVISKIVTYFPYLWPNEYTEI